jgi:hypothetical protein
MSETSSGRIKAAAKQIHHELGCTITAAEVAAVKALAAAELAKPSPSASASDGGERPVVAGVVARADERLRRGRFPLENDADLIRDLLEAVHALHHRRQLETDKKSDANCLSDIPAEVAALPAQGRPEPSQTHYYNYVTSPIVEYISYEAWWSYVVYPQ